jgi:IPT/TIG domain
MGWKRILWLSSVLLVCAANARALTPPLRISHFTPQVGQPAGGEVIRIHGNGFFAPVRVFFELAGEPLPREAIVIARTQSEVDVLTPGVPIALPGQQVTATIHVIINAGTASELRLTAREPFTFRKVILQPHVIAVSPSSANRAGGTQVSIFGEGFQMPVMVELIAPNGRRAEARVVHMTFDQIVILVPAAADLGAAPNEDIRIRVWNIFSNTDEIASVTFHYLPDLLIAHASPLIGPAAGGTRVQISGSGFQAPVAVIVAGVPAQVIRVSGSEILAVTGPLTTTSCRDVTGRVEVFDIQNGTLGQGPDFTYVMTRPVITSVSPTEATAGEQIEVSVAYPLPVLMTLTLADAPPVHTYASNGRLLFQVPRTIAFPRAACLVNGLAGTEPRPFTTDLRVSDGYGCTDAVPLTLLPPEPAACVAWAGEEGLQ